jgi:DNA-binding SARP family transcriptional activator
VSDQSVPSTDGSVTLALLGGWSLHGPSAGCPSVVPAAGQRLLAAVALRGPQTREQLSGLLWTDVPDDVAAARLRTVLWRLGGRGQVWTGTDGAVRLADHVDVDVVRLRAWARALEDGDDTVADTSAFAFDLLPGWYEDWLVVERERVRQLRLHALESLAAARTRSGHYATALEAALLAVSVDPLRESAHRAVIAVHLAEDNVSEAVRQFRRCRTALANELGVGPSASLVAVLPAAVTCV